jgi:hypothetical protein
LCSSLPQKLVWTSHCIAMDASATLLDSHIQTSRYHVTILILPHVGLWI